MLRYILIISIVTQIVNGVQFPNKLIYPETKSITDFDPYKKLKTGTDREKIIYKRFNSLFHETLVEPYEGGFKANFCASTTEDKKIRWHNKEIDGPAPNNTYRLYVDLPSTDQWFFHPTVNNNGKAISSKDIAVSLQYAVCAGVLPDIFKLENISVGAIDSFSGDDEDIIIEFNKEYPIGIINKYLDDVYIVDADVFEVFTEQDACNSIRRGQYGQVISKNSDVIDQFRTNPYGSGPFKKKSVKDKDLNLEKFSNYNRSVQLNDIELRYQSLKTVHIELLRKLDVSLALNLSISKADDKRIKISSVPSTETSLLLIDHTHPALKNVEVRKAIQTSIPIMDEIIGPIFKGNADLITGPWTKSSGGYNPELKGEYNGKNARDRIEIAKSILNKFASENTDFSYSMSPPALKYKGEKVKIIFNKGGKKVMNDDDLTRAVDKIEDSIEDIGISVTESYKVSKKFLKNKGNWDLAYQEFQLGYNEPVYPYYHTKGAKNVQGYTKSTLDDLFKRENNINLLDITEKTNIRQLIHKSLYDDYASIFLWSRHIYYGYLKTDFNNEIENKIQNDIFYDPEKIMTKE